MAAEAETQAGVIGDEVVGFAGGRQGRGRVGDRGVVEHAGGRLAAGGGP